MNSDDNSLHGATIVKLFCHEVYRVFADRIADELDDKWLKSLIYKTVVARFCTSKDLQSTLVEEREKNEEDADATNGNLCKSLLNFKVF
jgi:hypothetical protein